MPRARVTRHGPLHERRRCRGVSAASEPAIPASRARLVFRLISPAPGGLTFYPPLAGLLGFAVLALARVPDEAAKGRPCGERQARRNRTTSAAANPRVRHANPAANRFPLRVSRRPRNAPRQRNGMDMNIVLVCGFVMAVLALMEACVEACADRRAKFRMD
jgi:hypothetical protein